MPTSGTGSPACACILTIKATAMHTLAAISLPVDDDTVDRALEWLGAAADKAQWPARTVFKLRLCLDETLTNIASYAYDSPGADAGPPCVRLQLREDGPRITLQISDNGKAFDPTAQASRSLDIDLDDAQVGGHGLRLMRHYLDDIRYHRQGNWNTLELIATVDPAP